jgi:hypothetical protein
VTINRGDLHYAHELHGAFVSFLNSSLAICISDYRSRLLGIGLQGSEPPFSSLSSEHVQRPKRTLAFLTKDHISQTVKSISSCHDITRIMHLLGDLFSAIIRIDGSLWGGRSPPF